MEGEGWVDESMLSELAGRGESGAKEWQWVVGECRCSGEYWPERMWSDGR